MRSRKLGINLPWQIWEGLSEEQLVKQLCDRFEVYLNHEDSDFPFEFLGEDDFVVDRAGDILIEVVDFREKQRKWALTLALTFKLKRSESMGQEESLRTATRTVRFDIDPDTGRVDTRV